MIQSYFRHLNGHWMWMRFGAVSCDRCLICCLWSSLHRNGVLIYPSQWMEVTAYDVEDGVRTVLESSRPARQLDNRSHVCGCQLISCYQLTRSGNGTKTVTGTALLYRKRRNVSVNEGTMQWTLPHKLGSLTGTGSQDLSGRASCGILIRETLGSHFGESHLAACRQRTWTVQSG